MYFIYFLQDKLCVICVKNKARLISLDYKLNRDHEFLKHQLKVPTDGKGFWVGKKSINHWKRLAKIALEDTIVREVQEWNHSKDIHKVNIEDLYIAIRFGANIRILITDPDPTPTL